MNWMTRFRNYGFWLSLLAFVAGGLQYAGFDLGITEGNAIVDLIIAILVALGIINDPTTESKWYKDDSKS
ncbi:MULTISPECIES: phage holin [unclassified Thermoactinomyces]|uniref:phage holin n=1 Tax=unclassified Thermoactinomyces TaxID=2634588 RepID=UPI0018DB9799|nr:MULTISPECIES: phage holin [unclassified Thermoactinomyces]MBH8586742.1 holin [Thermoactinomyces sp. CICC 10520]MBI0392492.1 holin [Thermoactinomyces sp. CICC 24226]